MEQTVNLYAQILENLKNAIDPNFKNQLEKEHQIETLDQKWKTVRENIRKYLENIGCQSPELEKHLLSDGYFLYEDLAALFLDLIWQAIHNKVEVKETLYFYKNYKIQISDKNLLTYTTIS